MVSRDARLTFVWLLTLADDAGRFRAHPRLLAAELFPFDADADGMWMQARLDELVGIGKVRLAIADGTSVGQIVGWGTHQKIDKPSRSFLPVVPEGSRDSREGSAPHTVDHGPRTMDQESPNGLLSSSHSTAVREVFAAWVESTGRTRVKLDAKRRGVIERAIRDHGLQDCLDAVRGWVNDPWPDRRQHNDVAILLRDAAHVEKFRDLWRQGRPMDARHFEQAVEVQAFLDGHAEDAEDESLELIEQGVQS